MHPDSFIRILAGGIVLLSAALAHWVSSWWLLLTVFVGLNLIQSAFTGFGPPTLLLRKIGWVHRDGLVHLGREFR
jgi:hypothetical protein